jgi:hypothetical protein
MNRIEIEPLAFPACRDALLFEPEPSEVWWS